MSQQISGDSTNMTKSTDLVSRVQILIQSSTPEATHPSRDQKMPLPQSRSPLPPHDTCRAVLVPVEGTNAITGRWLRSDLTFSLFLCFLDPEDNPDNHRNLIKSVQKQINKLTEAKHFPPTCGFNVMMVSTCRFTSVASLINSQEQLKMTPVLSSIKTL